MYPNMYVDCCGQFDWLDPNNKEHSLTASSKPSYSRSPWVNVSYVECVLNPDPTRPKWLYKNCGTILSIDNNMAQLKASLKLTYLDLDLLIEVLFDCSIYNLSYKQLSDGSLAF